MSYPGLIRGYIPRTASLNRRFILLRTTALFDTFDDTVKQKRDTGSLLGADFSKNISPRNARPNLRACPMSFFFFKRHSLGNILKLNRNFFPAFGAPGLDNPSAADRTAPLAEAVRSTPLFFLGLISLTHGCIGLKKARCY